MQLLPDRPTNDADLEAEAQPRYGLEEIAAFIEAEDAIALVCEVAALYGSGRATYSELLSLIGLAGVQASHAALTAGWSFLDRMAAA